MIYNSVTVNNFCADFAVTQAYSVYWITLVSHSELNSVHSQLQPLDEIRLRHDTSHDLVNLFCYIPTKIFYIN